MNREMLERLAANPHYKMTSKQLQELHRLREDEKTVQHTTVFPKHGTSFTKHDTKPRKAGDDQSR